MMQKFAAKIKSRKTLGLLVLYILIKWTVILVSGSWLMKNGYWNKSYFLVIPVLAFTFFLIKKKRSKRKKE